MNSKFSAKEAAKAIEALQPELNAAVTIVEDPQDNPNQGPLAGIPVVLKDNINSKGLRTTASSKILDNYVPVYDATIVEKLTNAGAVIVAKSSMDELGMGGTNRNAATGPAANPWNTAHITGGSSGGSAALTAAETVPLAIGTDTGDSIRKPAAYCGVIGVKPTYGRISRYGIIPYASSLDTVGFFTRNIPDAALALEVLAGRDDHDMTSSFLPVPNYAEDLKPSVEGKNIGVFRTVSDRIVRPEMKEAFEKLVKDLEAAGAKIVDVTMDEKLMNLIAPVYKTIANAEATANHSNLDGIRFGVRKPGASVEEVMTNSRTAGFSSYVRARFVIGSYSLFEENQDRLFRKAQKIRRLLVDAYKALFEKCDLILAPAAVDVAPLIEESSDVRFGQDRFEEEHMQLANFSGYPSLTMPLGLADGLPFGINLTAPAFEEQNLFDAAAKIEEIIDWKEEPACLAK
ncbi:amidase [Allobaculum mucilyticum]|uniref:amidase n=1 Tax=Allobaculum mucilyticum TaxID=2834459 RepID=UPI001E429A3D|nr:amidase family protein [Allobaculum mucilyticum]UNT95670.1 aspartyl/glutamyl-tRNA amidotransferase subunit A [Allobaculum mucilyticum]